MIKYRLKTPHLRKGRAYSVSGVSIMAKKVAYGGDRSLMEKSLVGSKVKLYVGDDRCVKHEAVFIRRMDNRGHQTLVKKSVFFYPPINGQC